ncbi:MAG: PQQ-binding-like beta-propeller repeat protein [Pirellulaceae bacterium]|nr:PQQ-binding-like beta-propeller repeat protein [Pirellulaceae bacterium]
MGKSMVRPGGRLLAKGWMRLVLGLSCAFGTWAADSVHADWTRFRGPNGSGVAEDKEPTPTTWSDQENLKWKIALPGAGVSCPIVVGDKVFVTCYSGYGVNREEIGKEKDLKRHLVCIDRTTGKTLWEKAVPSTVAEDPYQGMGVPQHGYASHTPTSDGKNVYVFYGKSGVLAYDMSGNQLWQTSVGTKSDDREWGSSSSPILYEDLLIVPAGPEDRSLVGLDKYTGKVVWRTDPTDSLGNVWGTPALVKAGESTELVIGAPSEIWGLNPKNGKLRWYCPYIDSDQFSSSVVVDGDTVFAVEGRGGGSVAVKAGGKNDVSKAPQLVWTGRDSSSFASPIVYQDRLYYVSRKTITCIDAKTHDKIFEGRFTGPSGEAAAAGGPGGGGPGGGGPGGGGPGGGGRGGRGGGGFGGTDYGSPVIADGKIYFVARNGDAYVLEAGKEFKQLAVNRVTKETEDFSATPAISGGEIFIRSNKHLYCVSAKK